jgi:hypothetical protein
VAAFGFGLRPRGGTSDLPFLCWRDGLMLAAPAPHEKLAVSRTLAAFGHAMSEALHIAPALAPGFGAACGYLVCGVPAHADGQEACDLAATALRGHDFCGHDLGVDDVMADTFWRRAAPLLAATAELFAGWTADPSAHAALRAAWRRGRAIEMSGG